ncbi:hypothetical protein GC098_20315 [Paenibacillus sp. LMG 31458]|uniref:Uncharacterized protein n=1 Tax=Paenibacillus phytorum TaxID=2654977 RepID=A0ABX1XYR6_9BACL|nr:hypothetical protein [Paenibacillus phytorum]NOU73735.1 hypothetical protein [Paenibacillus phytorum]
MDKALEKKICEEIRKKLALSLKQFDFKRTKPTFYTRLKKDRIEFLHLHKFSFDTSFRVHVGVRFLCDSFEAVALNGIDSDFFRPEYNFVFGQDEESVYRCVSEMLRFIQSKGFKWFEDWSNHATLLNAENSPINRFTNEFILFTNGEIDEQLVSNSYKILGIKETRSDDLGLLR